MSTTLPLVPFETYMLCDDRDSHPMTFTVRLKFSGTCDRWALEEAIPQALERHPLLSARVAETDDEKLVWTWDDPVPPALDFADASVPLRFPGRERIDLTTNCGLRIWVRQGEGSVEMRLQFHHSCCDGIGAYGFVEDLLCAYHNAVTCEEHQVTLRPIDEERLRERTRFGLSWAQLLLRLPMEVWGLVVGFSRFFLHRPARVAADLPENSPPTDIDTLLDLPTKALSAQQVQRMKAAAKASGASLNDYLLSEMCVAVDKWNTERGTSNRLQPIRIMVPMNLRSPGDERMSAANVVAMVFADRNPGWFPSATWLLRSISWEMNFIKKLRLGLAFVRGVSLVDKVPGGLKFLTRPTRCYATGVLSNMGRVLSDTPLPYEGGKLNCGNLRLETIDSAPPVRPHTKVALSAVSYAGKLSLILNYDRHAFSREAAHELFAMIVRQVEDVAGETVEEPLKELVLVA